MPIRLYTVVEAVEWMTRRGLKMPSGDRIKYKQFMNYFGRVRKQGLQTVRVARNWLIPEGELQRLEEIWRTLTE